MEIYNGSISIKDTMGKIIFWDLDGTLAPYRFNGHVADPDGANTGMSRQEIQEGCFFYRAPSRHMQRVIDECGAKLHLIMGHCHDPKEYEDKNTWLDRYYPMIKERLLTDDNIPKFESIIGYCQQHGISLQDVLFVDDSLKHVFAAERHGISSWHISSFLDWNSANKV